MSVVRAVVLSSICLVGLVACVAGTNPSATVTGGDSGEVDAKPQDVQADADGSVDSNKPDVSNSGPFLAVCTSTLFGESIDRSLRFLTEAEVAANGKLSNFTMRPLPSGARKAARSETIGTPIVFGDMTTDTAGKSHGSLADATIPGPANPGSGSPLVFHPLAVDIRVSAKAKFCAMLGGKLTSPLTSDFMSTCLFFSVSDGDTFLIEPDRLTISAQSINARLADWVCN